MTIIEVDDDEVVVEIQDEEYIIEATEQDIVIYEIAEQGPRGAPAVPPVSITFSFDTPGILDGIDTGIVLPEGSFIMYGTVANLTTFDGDSPRIRVASTQADAIADGGGTQLLQAPVDFEDYDMGGNLRLGNPLNNVGLYTVGDCTIWIGLGKSGAGGDPGCTTGNGIACIGIVTP